MRASPRSAAVLVSATALLWASGCLTPDQIVALQKDVSDIRTQMEALRKENEQTAARMDEVRNSIEAHQEESRAQSADSRRQIDGMREDVRTVGTRLDELQQRLTVIAQSLVPGGTRPIASPAVPPPGSLGAPSSPPVTVLDRPSGNAEEIFNQAYADYSKGNYAPAKLGFEEFLERLPQSDRADDALYWIGLCHYDQGEYAEAIATFDRLLQEYPNGDKLPGAHLKKGLALLGMNRTAQGVVQLQYLAGHFPKTEEARIATDRLREIGARP